MSLPACLAHKDGLAGCFVFPDERALKTRLRSSYVFLYSYQAFLSPLGSLLPPPGFWSKIPAVTLADALPRI